MSIIEKAVDKRGQGKSAELPAQGAAVPASIAAAVPVETHEPPIADRTAATPPETLAGRQIEINLARLQKLGMVTPDGGRTPISEEFRLIKRPLIEQAFNRKDGPARHGNLIMVTSSLPDEGKTFCAVNLAISIAMERDHTVLLIDADVARPSIPEFLGLKTETGLMDILLDDKLDLADVMLKTNIDSLSFLPAGRNHKHATELLASQAMSGLLNEIANRYPDRIVIFDAPPVLLTSEARVLASQMRQIVLVVEAEKTTQHAVKNVIRQIGDNANLSLVYNKSRAMAGDGYYGHYYG